MSILKSRELHTCMGLNSCKNTGSSGSNECAGQGTCATAVAHPCHTLNDCKGQGGCGIFGTTEEFCYPGQNSCRFQGSCGVPILESRFIAQGPNKGRSVWQLARARFEASRGPNDIKAGPAPAGMYGPSNDYVNTINGTLMTHDNSSCSQSGSRACSYANDKTVRKAEAKANVLKMAEDSKRDLPESISTCPAHDKIK